MLLLKEMDLPVGAPSLAPLRGFVERCLEEGSLPPQLRRAITAGLDEALTPIIVGDGEGRRGHITVRIDINDTRLRVRLVDNTDGAELRSGVEDTPLQRSLRPRREIGFSLLRHVVDEIKYAYRRGFQNELELIKFL